MAKDETTVAQGRFTVALPAEVGAQVDQIGERLSEAIRAQSGIAVELSRAQIVQSLVKSALASTAQPNGDQAAVSGDGNADAGQVAAPAAKSGK